MARKVRRTTTGRRISIYASGAPFVLSFCKEAEIMEDGYKHWEASGEQVTKGDALQAIADRKEAKGEDLLARFRLTQRHGTFSLIEKRRFRTTIKLQYLMDEALKGRTVACFYRQDTMRPDICERWHVEKDGTIRQCGNGEPQTADPEEYVWLW